MKKYILRKNNGQSIVEFAIVLPILITLLLGIIDLGNIFQSYLLITNAVREATRAIALNVPQNIAMTMISNSLDNRFIKNQLHTSISYVQLDDWIGVKVDVTVPVKFITPIYGFVPGLNDNIILSTTSTFRTE
jgi:Flp pilus assembly protein TadG